MAVLNYFLVMSSLPPNLFRLAYSSALVNVLNSNPFNVYIFYPFID